MKRLVLISFLFLFLFSCKKGEPEFVQSNAIGNLFLLKNPPNNNSLLKELVIDFISKNPKIKNEEDNFPTHIYKYTSNTKDFIDSKRPGGYFRKYLEYYPQDEIAIFVVPICENDTTKRVGKLYYYGLNGSHNGIYEIDTLFYKNR